METDNLSHLHLRIKLGEGGGQSNRGKHANSIQKITLLDYMKIVLTVRRPPHCFILALTYT